MTQPPVPVPAGPTLVPDHVVPERLGTRGILAHVNRSGDWTLPRLYRVVACMGQVDLDLTRVRIGAGVSTIEVMVGGGYGIAPRTTGNILLVVTGMAQNVDNGGTNITIRAGSNTQPRPARGDPVTGTKVGQQLQTFAPGLTIPFTIMGMIKLDVIPIPGQYPPFQGYWFELSVVASSGVGAGVYNPTWFIMEI